MVNKIKNIFFLTSFLIFILFVFRYYFSDQNIIYINKSRLTYSLESNQNLPLLKSDTDNIIVYKNDLEDFKNKRKKRIWEDLISNNNE
tara:strand:- start:187 stop:450 length:264 start_codon:yes stop_codon:yes gene_type:complete